jgi:hypothetical protein
MIYIYTPCILQWLKAIGPAAVALAVFFVTWSFYRWQVRLAKQKLRHDLYDRRFAIYVAFRELLLALPEKSDDEIKNAFRKANIARFEAPFLLGDPKIQANLEALCKQVTEDVISNIMYRDAMESQVKNDPQIVRDYNERMDRLGQAKLIIPDRYFEELSEQFAKFLRITDFWK